jgi:hypothetical protein
MDTLTRDIEKSTRRVYRLFFGSRLFLKREGVMHADGDLVGVDMKMRYHGDKRLSFYVDRKTLHSLKERLGGPAGTNDENIDHDILGEMANIITGNAVSGGDDTAHIDPPERTPGSLRHGAAHMLNFSSKLGRLYIAIEDM